MNTEINFAQIVREKVNATLNNQKNEMVGAFIEEIHPDINVKYNSVNVIVGKQGWVKQLSHYKRLLR